MTDFDLVLHDWLLMKIAASGMELRVDIWFIRRESESDDIEKLQTDLDRLREWAVENWMIINSGIVGQLVSPEPG